MKRLYTRFLTLNVSLYRFNCTVIDRIIVIPFILIACSILQYLSIHYIHHCFFIMACYETNLKLLTTFISHIVCLRRTILLIPILISTLQLSLLHVYRGCISDLTYVTFSYFGSVLCPEWSCDYSMWNNKLFFNILHALLEQNRLNFRTNIDHLSIFL